MSDPDRMIRLAHVPDMHGGAGLLVHRDYDSVLLGGRYRLGLEGIGELQVALDRAVEQIRAYEARRQTEADAEAWAQARRGGPLRWLRH